MIKARLLEKTIDSGPWPCYLSGAQNVRLRVPEMGPPPPPPPPPPRKPGVKVAEADLRPHEIQDLADVVGDLAGAAVGYELTFRLRIELGGESDLPDEVVDKINQIVNSISENLKLI